MNPEMQSPRLMQGSYLEFFFNRIERGEIPQAVDGADYYIRQAISHGRWRVVVFLLDFINFQSEGLTLKQRIALYQLEKGSAN